MTAYPYSFIEQWWGESLSPELQQRIEAAPRTQLDIFYSDLLEVSDAIIAMPPRPDGILRPAILPLADSTGHIASGPSISMALNILLYAHEVIIGCPLRWGESIPQATAQLLALKPLADLGIIRFGGILSRVRHPSLYQEESALQDSIRKSYPELAASLTEETFIDEVAWVSRIVRLSDRLLNRSNPLVYDETQFKILTAILREAWIDRSYFALTSLAQMSLPSLDGKINELIAVRRSEESFARWREALSTAIVQLERIPDHDDNWQEDARDIISSELEPIREEVVRANSGSGVLSTLRSGTSAMAIAGAGVLAGWASGGKPLPALASSGASTGIVAGRAYLSSLKQRRANKAILDLALAFKSSE